MNLLSDSRSYFINEEFRLPVLAITTDSLNLWGYDFGLFLKKNIEIEREIFTNLDFYDEKGASKFSTAAGAKLQGNTTRYDIPQKSLKFYSRDFYENDEFEFKFWGNQVNDVVDKFEVKNGGQDWYFSFLRDAFTGTFVQDFDNVIIMEKRPIEAYINGKYWGTYILRNRFDEDYIAEKFDIDDASVNYLEDDSKLEQGDVSAYIDMVNNMKNLNLSNDSIFASASSKIDLNNFVEYSVFRIFSAVWDWPGSNHKIWNSPEIDDKWRFVLHDFDISFGYANADTNQNLFIRLDTMEVYYTTIYKSLLENQTYKIRFINTFADYLNSVFLKENTLNKLDSLSNIYSIAVQSQQARWDSSIVNWEDEVEIFREFLRKRPNILFNQMLDAYNLDTISKVSISQNIANACEFKLNTLSIKDSTWSGTYFADIPINISCIPNEGYVFYRWAGDTVIYEPNIEILPGDSLNLVAELVEEGKVSVELYNKGIKVYPNPVSNLLIIELANLDKSDFKELSKIRILDVLGQEVLNFYFNGNSNKHKLELDVSTLPPGTYIIKIGEISNKFIKL